MHYTNQKSKKPRLKKLLIPIALLLLLACGVTYYYLTAPKPVRQNTPKSTITSLPASNNIPNEKQPSTPSGSGSEGTAIDNTAKAPAVTTSPNQWAASSSGKIVVQQPLANAVIASGATLSGTSSLDTIQYRLIDDSVGVISQGAIPVTNGKYSVAISFQSHAKTGRLDVFSLNDTGSEINEVQLKIGF